MRKIKENNASLQTLWFVMLLLLSTNINAQSISSEVISNGGGVLENATLGSLSWTIGEVAVENLSASNVLTQGFQQGNLEISKTEENILSKISLYPNPTHDILILETDLENGPLIVNIFTLDGKKILNQKMEQTKSTIDISHLIPSIYVVHVENYNSKRRNSYKVVKQ